MVSTIGPSSSAVGIRRRAKNHAPATISSGYKRYAYHGMSIQLAEPAPILFCMAPESLTNRYTVTIGTTMTITITRMLCRNMMTVGFSPFISSSITIICDNPPGTLPIIQLERSSPVIFEKRKPSSRLNPMVRMVIAIIDGTWLPISASVSFVNEVPIKYPSSTIAIFRNENGQYNSRWVAMLHAATATSEPISHGSGIFISENMVTPTSATDNASANARHLFNMFISSVYVQKRTTTQHDGLMTYYRGNVGIC